jgi:hypothetical protein
MERTRKRGENVGRGRGKRGKKGILCQSENTQCTQAEQDEREERKKSIVSLFFRSAGPKINV